MPIDASIIQRGQAMRDANMQAGWNNLNRGLGTMIEDNHYREQMDLKKQIAGLDVDRLMTAALLKKQQGIPLTPQEEAGLKVGDMMRTSQQAFNPMTGGFYPKYTSLLGEQPMGAPMQAPMDMPMEPIPMASGLPQGFLQETAIDTPAATMAGQVAGDKKKEQAEAQAAVDLATMESQKERVAPVFNEDIQRLEEINEELKSLGALPTEENSSAVGRLGAQLKSSGAGRMVAPTTDPKVAALQKEYSSKLNALLPVYKKATGMTAGEGNTETEQENIKSAFGSPSGTYESNKKLLEAAKKKYGTSEGPRRRRYVPGQGFIN